MLRMLLALAVLSVLPNCIFGQAPPTPPDQMRQTLELSERLGQLETDGAPPFHLAASFEWFTADGKSAGQGTLDKLWKDSHHYRLTITLPTETLIEVDGGSQLWRTGKWAFPHAVGLAEEAALTPFLESNLATDRLSSTKMKNGSMELDCIATEPKLPGVSDDAELAQMKYCMSKDSALLRFVSRPNYFSIGFNDVKPFGNKFIARSIDISSGPVILIRLRVNALTVPDDFSSLDAPPPPDAQLLKFHRADVPFNSGEVMHGQIMNDIPFLQHRSGHSGAVVLKLHLNTAGRVDSADIISSPDRILSAIALDEVKQYRYRLSYQAGKVVAVDETLMLRFTGD